MSTRKEKKDVKKEMRIEGMREDFFLVWFGVLPLFVRWVCVCV